ncbi:MAG: OmpP1/FadL family transporter [Gemmataceae bacterium]
MGTNLRLTIGLLLALFCCQRSFGQGIILPGAGPVHRSMGGASTAVAVDPIGAHFWNPAVLSTLPDNQVGFGLELLYADTHVGSTIPAGSGPLGFPPETRSGNTRSDSGVAGAPAFGVVFHPKALPRVTMGMGLVTLAGASVNFPGDAGNPILSPNTPPTSNGFGPIFSSITLLASKVNMAVKVTDRLTVGVGGTVTTTALALDPALFAGRNEANNDGLSSFPAATHGHPYWGGGFQLGIHYDLTEDWSLGFGYKSPIWQETWTFRSQDEVGGALNVRLDASIPAVYSWGVAYKGLPRTILAADVRFIDYENTDLFGDRVIDGGVGWQNVIAVGVGGQHQLSDRVALRLGYVYNDNPVPSTLTLFNTQLPAILQHQISVGGTIALNDYMDMNLAYIHGVQNSISGGVPQLEGADVTLDTELHSIALGLNIRFGSKCSSRLPVPKEEPYPEVNFPMQTTNNARFLTASPTDHGGVGLTPQGQVPYGGAPLTQ